MRIPRIVWNVMAIHAQNIPIVEFASAIFSVGRINSFPVFKMIAISMGSMANEYNRYLKNNGTAFRKTLNPRIRWLHFGIFKNRK